MSEETTAGYRERLLRHLTSRATEMGLLKGELLQSPDIDAKWQDIAPDYLGDAVREFNTYPDAVLAWAAYLGAAVAFCWDADWAACSDRGYSFWCGDKGFDYLDEHVTANILGIPLGSEEAAFLTDTMKGLASTALSFLRHSGFEPGTVDAYRAVILSVEAMFITGASIELHSLGYIKKRLTTK